jgi:hypothetical protein
MSESSLGRPSSESSVVASMLVTKGGEVENEHQYFLGDSTHPRVERANAGSRLASLNMAPFP